MPSFGLFIFHEETFGEPFSSPFVRPHQRFRKALVVIAQGTTITSTFRPPLTIHLRERAGQIYNMNNAIRLTKTIHLPRDKTLWRLREEMTKCPFVR